jgi:hypothetical protein
MSNTVEENASFTKTSRNFFIGKSAQFFIERIFVYFRD